MRPCTGALIGGIIYSRTKEESCPAKPAARSFPYSTRRQQPARENHTDAKERLFFCVGFFFFIGLAFGALKAMGALSPSGSPKSKSVGLFHCMDAFFTGLAFGALKAMGILSPSGSPKSKSVGLFRCAGAFSSVLPSVRQRQWVLSPLRLAKVQKRGPFSLCGFLPPTFCKQKAALSRRKRRLSAGEINKITSRAQRPAFRSNSSSCWPVARSQAVNTPFSYSI